MADKDPLRPPGSRKRPVPGSANPLARSPEKGGYQLPKLPKKKKAAEGIKGQAVKYGVCGAKTRGGGLCKQAAGFGTTHLGIGRCKYHGGNMRNHIAHEAKKQAVLLGCPKEMNPVEAIIWCIKIKAGEVEWYSQQIAEIDETDWHENTVIGKQMHLYVRERQLAMKDLFKFSRDAIALGLAERAVKLAEMYGEVISRLLNGVLSDLELTPIQKQKAPQIVRKHLILLEGGRPINAADRKLLERAS